MPSVTFTEMVVWAMPLSDVSATASAETDRVMVSPTVDFWTASSMAVMFSYE